MKVDLNGLRFKDWKEIESLSGRKMGWYASQLQSGMDDLSADDFEILVWVAGKRANPAFTREEASELGPQDLESGANPTPSGSD